MVVSSCPCDLYEIHLTNELVHEFVIPETFLDKASNLSSTSPFSATRVEARVAPQQVYAAPVLATVDQIFR